MREYLPPLFQLLFGLGMILFLVAAMRWRTPLYAKGGHLLLVGMFMTPMALFFLSRGIGQRADSAHIALMVGGVMLLVGVVIQFFAIQKFVRPAALAAEGQK